MIGVLLVATLACWGMSLYKLRDLARDPGNRPLRALCLSLWSVTLALTVQPVGPWLDQRSGVLDLARLIGNCLSLACVTGVQAFHLHMVSDEASAMRRVRRAVVLLAMAVATMVVLFVVTPPAADLADPRVRSRAYYAEPFDAPFLYVYLAYLGWSLLQMAILSRRYAGLAPRPLLRAGLRLVTLSASWGLLYVAGKLGSVVADRLQPGLVPLLDGLVIVSFLSAVLLALVGATLPSWGPRLGLDRLWDWAGALRDYRRLHPLWRRIHEVVPQIALLPPPSGPWGTVTVARDAALRRVRITVEILDGYAALRPWMSAEVAARARRAARERGLSPDEEAAVVEAAVVGAALRARRADEPPAAGSAAPVPLSGAGDLGAADQVSWLARVARAMDSPTVRAVVAADAPALR